MMHCELTLTWVVKAFTFICDQKKKKLRMIISLVSQYFQSMLFRKNKVSAVISKVGRLQQTLLIKSSMFIIILDTIAKSAFLTACLEVYLATRGKV